MSYVEGGSLNGLDTFLERAVLNMNQRACSKILICRIFSSHHALSDWELAVKRSAWIGFQTGNRRFAASNIRQFECQALARGYG